MSACVSLNYDLGVVVPVRRGSSRIREKCLLPFADKPSLIEWKLSQLVRVIDPPRVWLSSEDEDFLALGKPFGVSLHHRAARLARGHEAPFRDVITGIVEAIPHDHVAWATVVCPLMAPLDYAKAFTAYERQVVAGKHDSLLGVNEARDYYWSDRAPLNYSADRDHTISQDLPDWFRVTNSLYMAPRALMLEREYFLGSRPLLHVLPKMAGVDIDTFEDYRIACALHTLYREEAAIEPGGAHAAISARAS
jgi:CMP-N-acetylneuraminic acid synthetase